MPGTQHLGILFKHCAINGDVVQLGVPLLHLIFPDSQNGSCETTEPDELLDEDELEVQAKNCGSQRLKSGMQQFPPPFVHEGITPKIVQEGVKPVGQHDPLDELLEDDEELIVLQRMLCLVLP